MTSAPRRQPELFESLRSDPDHTAILLDVDGTLAPIVDHADDAHIPEATRRPLIEIAKQYRLVACVSGRLAADARRIVSLGSIAYLGSHGAELLRPGATTSEVDPEMVSWQHQVQDFCHQAMTGEALRQRIRLEDKGSIVAFHWRGVPSENDAERVIGQLAQAAEVAGFSTYRGRKVLEIRPPVEIDKGAGIKHLLEQTGIAQAIYFGDDATDLDAFRALDQLIEAGELRTAIRVGVRSEEAPSRLVVEADLTVDGPDGVRGLLQKLVL